MAVFVVTGYPQSLDGATNPGEEPIVLLTKPLDYPDLLRRLAATLGAAKAP
jgi:hypothetical protein